MQFTTEKNYTDRESKASYVYDKYKDILKGKILGVDSDNCYLRSLLGKDAQYTGIGIAAKRMSVNASDLYYKTHWSVLEKR